MKTTKSLQPGDQVLIKAGTYREAVAMQASGTADQPITFAACPGDEGKVLITGSDLIKDWKKASEVVYTTPWQITFDSHYPPEWISKTAVADYGRYAKRCEMVFIGDPALTQVLGTGLMRRGTFAVDESRKIIRIALPEKMDFSEAEVSVRQQGLSIRGNHLHVKGLSVIHVANPYEQSAFSVSGDDNVVENCRAEWNNLDGLRVSGHRARVLGNVADHNGDCGMVITLQDSRIENNQTNENSWRMGAGTKAAWKVIGGKPAENVFLNHVAKDNHGAGIRFDTCGGNNRVEHCRLEGNLIAGLEFENCAEGNSASNNVICGTRAIPNVLYPSGDGVGVLMYESSGVTLENNVIANNVAQRHRHGRAGPPTAAFAPTTSVKHNIIANNGETGLVFWVWGKSGEPSSLTSHRSDHNLWYEPNAKLAVTPAGEASDLKQMQGFYGQDAHSVTADPMFVAAEKGDYHLRSGSPVGPLFRRLLRLLLVVHVADATASRRPC